MHEILDKLVGQCRTVELNFDSFYNALLSYSGFSDPPYGSGDMTYRGSIRIKLTSIDPTTINIDGVQHDIKSLQFLNL